MAGNSAKEHTTVGLSKSTLMAVCALITVLAALAFWNDRGGDAATTAAAINQSIQSNTARNDNQDVQIAETQKEIKRVVEEQHKAEVATAKMVKDITATATDVSEMKGDFKDLKNYLMQYDFKEKDK